MIFMSYSSEQDDLAQVALRDLAKRDVSCWYAPRDVPAGGDWAREIIASIRRSKAVLVIISDSAADRGHVQRELQAAIDAKVPIYWLKLTDEFPDDLRYELTSTNGIEWENRDEVPEPMLDALVMADKRVLGPEGMEALRRTPWVIGVGVALWWALLYCVLVLLTVIFASWDDPLPQGGGASELAMWSTLFGLIVAGVCTERAARGTRLVDVGGVTKIAMVGHVVGAIFAVVYFTMKGGPRPGDWWVGPAFAAAFVSIWVHFLAVRLDE